MSQPQRLSALSKFKSGVVKILVATDVASRGLDIPEVELVVNSNVPASPKDYIHRVGRTARAGKGGMAVTMVTQYDIERIKKIEAAVNTKLTEFETSEKEVLSLLKGVLVARREAELRVRDSDILDKRKVNKRKKDILDGKDPDAKHKKKKQNK
jgi:ATP-dependent RNA helicase DDX49/DBP8